MAILSCPREMRYVCPTSKLEYSRSAHSFHAVARISPESSVRSSEKTLPSPFAELNVRISDLEVTVALICQRLEYGLSPSIGVERAATRGDWCDGAPCMPPPAPPKADCDWTRDETPAV